MCLISKRNDPQAVPREQKAKLQTEDLWAEREGQMDWLFLPHVDKDMARILEVSHKQVTIT